MKTLKIILVLIAFLMLLCGGGYLYASSGVQSKVGYANLSNPKANALISLKLGPNGLAPIRWFIEKALENNDHHHEAHERLLSNIMHDVQGAQLRIYDVGENRQVFDGAIAEAISGLKRQGWQSLMTIRDTNETVIVLQYGSDEIIEGLSIMLSMDDNAVFLNLVGPFDPQAFAETVNRVY